MRPLVVQVWVCCLDMDTFYHDIAQDFVMGSAVFLYIVMNKETFKKGRNIRKWHFFFKFGLILNIKF